MRITTEKWVLIVGGKSELVIKAKSLGLQVIHFQSNTEADLTHLSLADYVLITDLKKPDSLVALAKALHQAIPFSQVISLSEDTLVPAAIMRDALKLGGTSLDTVMLLKNKFLMRQRLESSDCSPVKSAIGYTLIDLKHFLHYCKSSIIAKPVDSAGSTAINRIATDDEAKHAWNILSSKNFIPFLMEEYLEGPEFSVETFSFNGQHIVITITDKFLGPNYVEIGHTVPAQIEDSQKRDMVKLTTKFLDAIGLTDGPSHTEIKLTPNGPRIIESHNRVGGDHINEIVQAAFGVDMKKMALAWLLGLVAPLTESPKPQGASAIRFFAPPAGIVKEITGLETVAKHKNVIACDLKLKVGDKINPLSSSSDRSGYIIVRAEDALYANKLADELIKSVNVTT